MVKMKTSWSDYISLHTQFVQYSAKVNLVNGAQKMEIQLSGNSGIAAGL
ncbi:hypothetical protein [Paenibacillus validus]